MSKKNNLKYYIALMTFALVGLVILQYHWLNKAYQTNQEKFKYNVQMALNNVANSLPFAEANYYVSLAKKDSNTCENPQDLSINIPQEVKKHQPINPIPPTPPQIVREAVQKDIYPDNENNFDQKNYPVQNFQANWDSYFDNRIDNQQVILENSIEHWFNEQQNRFYNEYKQFENFDISTPLAFQLDSLALQKMELKTINLTEKINAKNEVLKKLYTEKLSISSIKTENVRINIGSANSEIFFNISSEKLHKINPENIKSIVFTSNKKPIHKNKRIDKNINTAVITSIPTEKFVTKKDASCTPPIQAQTFKYYAPVNAQKIIQVKEKKDILKLAIKFEETDERKKDIQKRLENIDFEERIKKEFKQRGIILNYNFVINSQKRKTEIEEKNASMSAEKTTFQVELFPLEQSNKQHFLQINFPNLTNHYLENMWENMFSSLLFIALIIFCFGKAVSTILKQKKIAAITNDFINNMTHELKTPISTVSLACEALQDKDIQQMPKQRERYLTIIEEENKRLGSQVERVLQIAKLDKGDVELAIEIIDVHETINNAIEKIGLQIESRGGKIITEFLANEPFLKADEVHLTNIILNLLDNANKYSPENPDISVKTENTKNGIKISIADKGKGMSKEQQSKVFEKFYRVPTGNVHNVKGFGLGLSYVKMMTQAQHGTIHLKSEQGKGSVFSVEFQGEKVS